MPFRLQLTRVWRHSLGGNGGESVNSAGSPVKLWFSITLIATERRLIVRWLCNNILKIRQNRFGET